MRCTVATVLLVLAGCSNLNKKENPRVETKDASQVGDRGTSPGVATVEEIRKLFYDARGCSKPCMARARSELQALMKSAPADVAAAALEIMADPEARTDQGVGLEAMLYVDDWLKTGLDEESRRRTSHALERVVATGSTFMRYTAYSHLSFYRLPDAERILMAEVENPARDLSDRAAAGGALGGVIDDFALIRTWLLDDQPVHWLAALSMMMNFHAFNDRNKPLWAEGRTLLVRLGKRPELPGEVVSELARLYGYYLEDDPDDPEIRPLAERWVNHPDDMAAGAMRKILLAHTSWRLPPR